MKNVLIILCCLLGVLPLSAQTRKAYERAGDEAFAKKEYNTAIVHYAEYLKKSSDSDRVWYKYAECARMMYAYAEAEKALLRLESSKKDVPLLYLRLGEVQRGKGNYTAASSYLEKYLAENADAPEAEEARRVLAESQWALEAQRKANGVQVKPLGKSINSPYSDFAPIRRGDTLYFSSYRFDRKTQGKASKQKITRMMMSVGGARAREPGRGYPVGGDSVHIAHTAFTWDGNFMFYNQCKNLSEGQIRCELWLTVRDLRGRWGQPIRLPEPVNIAGTTTTQVSIGFDSATLTQRLWFASDRAGGKGGLDIWYVPLDTNYFCPCNRPRAGKVFKFPPFAAPRNAAWVNTSGDDMTPFYSRDLQTLYFSTDARTGFGGADIFSSKNNGLDQWGSVENMGPGFNSSYNDLYFFLDSGAHSGLLSSNRPGSLYLDESNKACCNDIFAFQIPEPQLPPELTPPGDEQPPVVLTPPEELPKAPPVLSDFVGLPLYFDNDEPDKRTRKTTTQKNYEETVLSYLERQSEYRVEYAKGLTGSAQEEAEERIDQFFDNEVRQGYERLEQLCGLILQRLEKGEQMKIVIKGFTSPRAESDYNLNLGKRRISSVRNYFDAYSDGAFEKYIRSGQLNVLETSFGETTAKAGVSDKLEDIRNSVFSPAAARERRVEIIEITSF